jgi:hypothetical protein
MPFSRVTSTDPWGATQQQECLQHHRPHAHIYAAPACIHQQRPSAGSIYILIQSSLKKEEEKKPFQLLLGTLHGTSRLRQSLQVSLTSDIERMTSGEHGYSLKLTEPAGQ